MSNNITLEQFQRVLPKNSRMTITPKMVDNINAVIADPVFRENYRDNLLSYTSVMQDGRFTLQQYVDAVRYVSCKLVGKTNIGAYTATFPDRIQRYIDDGFNDKEISSYVSSYNKNILVNLITEQTLVPSHVLNADLFQRALNTQVQLMTNAKSEKVRSDAANSVLTHLKRPEVKKIELDVAVKDDSSIRELRNATMKLVAKQKEGLLNGDFTPQEVAHSKIIEGELIEDV